MSYIFIAALIFGAILVLGVIFGAKYLQEKHPDWL